MKASPYIYIYLFGDVEDWIDTEEVGRVIQKEFRYPLKITSSEIDPQIAYDDSRSQYYSTKILKEMLSHLPNDALRAVGIVSFDLFIPILTFVFGEAQLNGKVGIVSIFRLRQEYYGLPPNPPLLHRRLIKEIKHELGHTFGLIHCPKRECIMSVAHNVMDVDSKGMDFCKDCKDLLERNRKG